MGLHVVFFLIVVTVGKSQPLVANLSVLALVAGMFTLAALRFRNQGASGWWAIGIVVPILNIYVAIRALAYPEGT